MFSQIKCEIEAVFKEAFNKNLIIYDDNAQDRKFTKRLISLIKNFSRRNYGPLDRIFVPEGCKLETYFLSQDEDFPDEFNVIDSTILGVLFERELINQTQKYKEMGGADFKNKTNIILGITEKHEGILGIY